ncbi:hypothetical protein CAI21_10075 [Alkalilimnicola ehrlichii]|uniref:Oxidoreductase n=1 Tax=Alkalilimnicola ehrlichii TaxID=351052 RepID=A0A3E0WV96_9GAMM|nr:SDR family NAD(P)-dependent oxidoreductase [Alkalilimnicola ehrlichii]RFA29398.1 hypothetical protein CAI21_10075 [Alkalilimnicola ehrlichii]RFA36912.1 hypothetical protein CAL65_10410 [Alkalilimnicola ehrlichii]
MKLQRRKALVTGATSGIGYAITEKLLANGCSIVACGRNEAVLQQLKDRHGDRVDTLTMELTDPATPQQVAEYVERMHPDLSILINNAGIQVTMDFTTASYDKLQPLVLEELQVNVAAPILLAASLLNTLRKQDLAMIVNITTGLALSPKKSSPVYCATKAALHSFSKSLRYQLKEAAPNVHLLEALPPLVDTRMAQGRGSTTGKISPEHVANAVVNAIEHEREETYIGKAQLLRVINRVTPNVAERILSKW